MDLNNFLRKHFTAFPIRVFVLRALADEVDPWPAQYEGLKTKISQSTNQGKIEVHSLWLRRSFPSTKRKIGFFLGFCLPGALLGWILGAILEIFLAVNFLVIPMVVICAIMIGSIGYKVGTSIEMFEIPQQPQAAFQSNKDSDVLWLLQTDLNDFAPILFKNKKLDAMVESFIPKEYEWTEKWADKIDEQGNPVFDDSGKPIQEKVLDPKTKKPVLVPVIDPKTGAPKVTKWDKQLIPKTFFDANFYLSGDPKNPVVKRVPYAVAYKSSDLYQWLLLQAERQKFYMLNDFWATWGNMISMILAGIIIVLIVAVGLQQYSNVTGQLATGLKGVAESQNGYTQALLNFANNTAVNATRIAPH